MKKYILLLLYFLCFSVFSKNSPWQEQLHDNEIGYLFLQQLQAQLPPIPQEDFLRHYINNLKNILFQNLDSPLKECPVFLINRADANAFAMPNAAIVLTLGLLAQTENEDQLAYVIAHELGHLHHQHSMHSQHYNKYIALQTASLLIMSAFLVSANWITPAILSAQAYAQQKTLAFSRIQETQADEFAYFLLKNAHFSEEKGLGILWVLSKLSHWSHADIPDFLLSHPQPHQRLAHFHPRKKNNDKPDNLNYLLMRQQARYILKLDKQHANCHPKKNLESNYVHALHALQQGSLRQIHECTKMLENSQNLYTELLYSQLLIHLEKINSNNQSHITTSTGIKNLEDLYQKHPQDPLVTMMYTEELMRIQEFRQAEIILNQRETSHYLRSIDYLKAQIAEYQGQCFEKHILLAQYYAQQHAWKKSIIQLTYAKKLPNLNNYQKWQLEHITRSITKKNYAYHYWLSSASAEPVEESIEEESSGESET